MALQIHWEPADRLIKQKNERQRQMNNRFDFLTEKKWIDVK